MKIFNHEVYLRSVQFEDAEFIVKLRTDSKNSRFISTTSTDIEEQKRWLQAYKKREKIGKEFYFIGNTIDNIPFGTTRLYNFNKDTFTNGSWVVMHDTNPKYSVMIDLLARSYAFNEMGFETCFFDVRKENKKIINYHKRLGAKLKYSSGLDNYYTIEKNDFFDAIKKLSSLGLMREKDLQYSVSK